MSKLSPEVDPIRAADAIAVRLLWPILGQARENANAALLPRILATQYQRICGIIPSRGTIGPRTLTSLALEEAFAAAQSHNALYQGFVGHILALEGRSGEPYRPGGNSGVTLDPGFDLGHNTVQDFDLHYAQHLQPAALALLTQAVGLKGEAAEQWLTANEAALSRIQSESNRMIPPHDALAAIGASVIYDYWQRLIRRWTRMSTYPPAVQMGVLSLFYNKGAGVFIRTPDLLENLQESAWEIAASIVQKLDLDSPGLNNRRRFEAGLIRRGATPLREL